MKQCRVVDCTKQATVFVKIQDKKVKRIYVCKECAELIEKVTNA